jgi:hypothetical protein
MLTLPTVSAAGEVQLNFCDGSGAMTGSLTGYQGGIYELETALGAVFVSTSRVNCQGDICPPAAQVLLDRQVAAGVVNSQSETTSDTISTAEDLSISKGVLMDADGQLSIVLDFSVSASPALNLPCHSKS